METASLYHQIKSETSTYDICCKREIFPNTVQYINGVQIPTKEALKLDAENDNDNCMKAIRLEIQQLMDYDTFIGKGLRNQMPNNYTKIRCHMIFTVKHNG